MATREVRPGTYSCDGINFNRQGVDEQPVLGQATAKVKKNQNGMLELACEQLRRRNCNLTGYPAECVVFRFINNKNKSAQR